MSDTTRSTAIDRTTERRGAPPKTGSDASLREREARRDGTSRPSAAKPKLARSMSRKRMIWIGAAALAALLIAWMLRPTPLDVETGHVVRGSLETVVEAEGVTRVRDRYQIGAPVTGRLARITLREGDIVQAGTVLASITPVPLDPQALTQAQARVSAAEAGVQEAQARVAQARELLDQAERTAARLREMAAAGAISSEDAERAELQVVSSRRELEAAQSRARTMAAELTAARAGLLNVDPGRQTGRAAAVVRSPAAGRVLRVHERSERVVTAGTPLVEVGDAMGLEVVVDVLSTDAVQIEIGAPMRLVEWGGAGVLDATVRLVEPAGFTRISALGVEEQRVNVIGDLPQPPPGLGDGYRVEAQIITWQADDVIKVSNSAIFRAGTEWTVFVVEGGRARLREVRVGRRGSREAEVISGLAEDDVVVLFPADQLSDGMRVRAAS